MQSVPTNLKYTKTHEWALLEDGVVTVGITEHAQELLGEMVFVEVPEVGSTASPGSELSVVESVKAASDVYSPVGGEVVEVNEALEENPALVNEDPYGGGWLFKIKIEDSEQMNDLLDADAYNEQLENEDH